MKCSLPFVVVEWEDAWGDPTEVTTLTDVHVKHKPALYRTYGFLLYEDAKGVSLTNEECVEDKDYRGRNFINHALVRSITRLSITKARERKQVSPTV